MIPNFLNRLVPIRSGKVPLQLVLTLPFLLKMLAAVSFVSYISYLNGRQAGQELASQVLNQASSQTLNHLHAYTQLPPRVSQLVADDLNAGHLTLSANDLRSLDRYFLQRSRIFVDMSFIYVGNEDGKFIGAGPVRNSKDFSHLIEVTDGTTQGNYVSYAIDGSGARSRQVNVTPNYDPRRRPWYQAAMAAGETTWSEIYAFIGQANTGLTITAVTPFQEPSGKQGVTAVDLYLNDISAFLKTLEITRSGQVLVLERNGSLVASSNAQPNHRIVNGKATRIAAIDSENPLVQQTIQSLQPSALKTIEQRQMKFQWQGATQWMQITPFRDPHGLDWLIVVTIPESKFTSQIEANLRNTFALAAVIVLIAIAMGVTMARLVVRPILQLSQAAKSIVKGNWNSPLPSDRADEIGELARSFRNMVEQLQLSFDDLKATNTALFRKEEQLQRLTSNVPGVIYRYVMYPDGRDEFLFISPRCRELYEIEPAEVLENSQVLWAMIHPEDVAKMRAIAPEAITSQQTWSFEYRIRTPSGQQKWLQNFGSPESQSNGDIYWDGVVIDITPRKYAEEIMLDYHEALEQEVQERTTALVKANEALERLATLDGLTQVANRRQFDQVILQTWKRSQRESQPVSLILCDVDYFKRYNDAYGHQAGDVCLKCVAQVMKKIAKRPADLVARYGGEEFAILLPNTNLKGACQVAEQIRRAVQAQRLLHCGSDVSRFVTVSSGVATMIPCPSHSVKDLIGRSDRALYQAKNLGRDRIFYES